jgi:hypothetical protein
LAGVLVYHRLERWGNDMSFLEAVYFSIVTLTT